MEDVRWIDGLGQREAADAVVEARARLLRAEADRLALAVHWADLHDSESVSGAGSGRLLPGADVLCWSVVTERRRWRSSRSPSWRC